MNGTKKIWFDGELVDWAAAQIPVTSFGLHYGIGFFEGVRCYRTDLGPAGEQAREELSGLLDALDVAAGRFEEKRDAHLARLAERAARDA